MNMKDYKTIFETIESSLIAEGSKHLSTETIRANLDWFKQLEGKKFSNDEYCRILVDVIFYSGFRAATVNSKIDIIHRHFSNYELVADYNEIEINNILADKEMIRNRRKIVACAENAKTIRAIIQQDDSFQDYIERFKPKESFENLMLLKEEREDRFLGLGKLPHIISSQTSACLS